MLKRLWNRFILLFIHHEEVKPKRKYKRRKKDNFGSFYYFGDLLDRLETYFKNIQRLKKADLDAYNLYRKAGGQVCNGHTLLEAHTLHPRLREVKPSFFMLHIDTDKDRDEAVITPSFFYVQKMKWMEGLQPTRETIYKLSMFFSDKKHFHVTMDAFITMSEDGSMSLLKHKTCKKHGNGIPQTIYRYPDYLVELHRENKRLYPDSKLTGENPEQYALNIFRLAMNSYFNAYSGFQINVTDKLGHVATFYIDMLRSPYFFKDRKNKVNHNGKTKKIFHIVRTHRRKTGAVVKSHFRGLRKFSWKGYKVNIQNPKEELSLFTWEAAAIDESQLEDGVKYIRNKELGETLNELRK